MNNLNKQYDRFTVSEPQISNSNHWTISPLFRRLRRLDILFLVQQFTSQAGKNRYEEGHKSKLVSAYNLQEVTKFLPFLLFRLDICLSTILSTHIKWSGIKGVTWDYKNPKTCTQKVNLFLLSKKITQKGNEMKLIFTHLMSCIRRITVP